MYRIEVSPGEETVFRTIEELATAIRNGLVTPRSRIYHNASQKWLPIEFHPHYKKALETPERPRPVPAAPAAAMHPPMPPPAEPTLPPAPPAPAPPPVSVKPARPAGPARTAAFPLPPVLASLPLIEVELPEIAYPEPVARGTSAPQHATALPVARRRAAGGRPLLYAGAAVGLVIVGYLVTTAAQSSGIVPEPAPAVAAKPAPAEEPLPMDEFEPPSAEEPEPPIAETTKPPPTPEAAPAPASAPAQAPLGPQSQAWSSSAGATTPPPTPAPRLPSVATPAPAIVPAPAALDLSASSIQVAESLAPTARAPRDTGAIGRILKAVSASKPSESNSAR